MRPVLGVLAVPGREADTERLLTVVDALRLHGLDFDCVVRVAAGGPRLESAARQQPSSRLGTAGVRIVLAVERWRSRVSSALVHRLGGGRRPEARQTASPAMAPAGVVAQECAQAAAEVDLLILPPNYAPSASELATARQGGVGAAHREIGGLAQPGGVAEVALRSAGTPLAIRYWPAAGLAPIMVDYRQPVTRPTAQANAAKVALIQDLRLEEVLASYLTRGHLAPAAEYQDPRPGEVDLTRRQALSFAWAMVRRLARDFRLLFWTHTITWRVCVATADDPARLRPRWQLAAPVGTWFADPFLVSHDGVFGVLVEQFIEELGKARIAFVPMGSDGPAGPAVPVLEEDFHLSFPWTFAVDGELYMSPEASRSNSVRIYRAREFPVGWEHVATHLQGVRASDPLIFQGGDGRWYLLVNVDSSLTSDASAELHAYWSDDPVLGPWEPIAGNPQVCDPLRARNGGLLSSEQGLTRVGQRHEFDAYGAACAQYAITHIGPDGYEEHFVANVAAEGALGEIGPHHLSQWGDMRAFDFSRRSAHSRHGHHRGPRNTRWSRRTRQTPDSG